MALLDDLASKAKSKFPRILLPESTDSRVIAAAKSVTDQKIAQIVLLDGDTASAMGVESINPKNEDLKVQYAQTLFELRKHKGVTFEKALEMLSNSSVFSMVALKRGDVDGF